MWGWVDYSKVMSTSSNVAHISPTCCGKLNNLKFGLDYLIQIWGYLPSILVNLALRENHFLILPLSCKFCFNIFQFQVLISLCLKTCWLFIFRIYSTKFDLKCAWLVWNYWNVFCFLKTKIKSRLSEFVAEIRFVVWNSSHPYTIHVYLNWLRCSQVWFILHLDLHTILAFCKSPFDPSNIRVDWPRVGLWPICIGPN